MIPVVKKNRYRFTVVVYDHIVFVRTLSSCNTQSSQSAALHIIF